MSTIKKFKKAGQMKDGIEALKQKFLWRAKEAHKEVLRFKQRDGLSCYHELYLRARAERSQWLWAAKELLIHTTKDGYHREVNRRRCDRYLARAAAAENAVQLQEAA